MKLKISAIRDAGVQSKERVVIKVISPTNVGEYILLLTSYKNGSVTTGVRKTFWFPDKEVGAGDYVVIYTKSGSRSEKDFKEVKSHFYYWGDPEAFLNQSDRSLVLMHAPDWESFRAGEST